ncbi:hypothetical protein [Streptomyces sp. NPDC127105]|uniref:hypothetical protein n=1 Tax=Streptomyces sp. NPDC127105 TaxID=3345359 RepID=UPI003646F735
MLLVGHRRTLGRDHLAPAPDPAHQHRLPARFTEILAEAADYSRLVQTQESQQISGALGVLTILACPSARRRASSRSWTTTPCPTFSSAWGCRWRRRQRQAAQQALDDAVRVDSALVASRLNTLLEAARPYRTATVDEVRARAEELTASRSTTIAA